MLKFFLNSSCRRLRPEIRWREILRWRDRGRRSRRARRSARRRARKLFSSELSEESAAVPGRDHASDFAPHQFLRNARIFHLLADGDLESLADQLRDVAFGGVVGNAAHRDGDAFFLVARGQRDLQFAGGEDGVVEEKLVEVSQAEEQQGAGMLLLDGGILPHQRRGRLGHFERASCADYNKLRVRCCTRCMASAGFCAKCIRTTVARSQLTRLDADVFLTAMELRKDPITRSWVITGDDVPEHYAARRKRSAGFVPTRPQPRSWSPTCRECEGGPGRRARWCIPRRCTALKASRRAAATAFTIACARSARTKCWWRIARHDRAAVERQRCRDRAVPAAGGATHSGS